MDREEGKVDYFVTLVMGIMIDGEWFLPFQQLKLLDMEMRPMVDHITRSGFKLTSKTSSHLHYLVERNGINYFLPFESGYITNKKIPEEWVNRYILEERYRSDNITDYVKAAKKYLNIEIKAGPDIAWWRMIRAKIEKEIVGKNLDKDEVQ